MGTLTAPRGLVYADTQVLVYSVEKHPVFWPLLRPLWEAMQEGSARLVTSELTLMETLIGPLRRADTTLESQYETLFQGDGIRLVPIARPILREAARLRATIPALRTPDALHAATALQSGCAMFLSNDSGFRRVPDLPLVVLSDVLPA